MNSLDDYLRGDHRSDKQEAQEIDNLIGNILLTLIKVVDDKYFNKFSQIQYSWPYEIGPKATEQQRTYSISTNAMILFALENYFRNSEKKDTSVSSTIKCRIKAP